MLEKSVVHTLACIAREKERRVLKHGLLENDSAVLCFHNVSNVDKNVFSITESHLIHILDELKHPVSNLDALLSREKKTFVLTFDDGYESIYQIVYPLLKERCIPFVIYIITDRINSDGYLTSKEIKELSLDAKICTIGSHMCSHRKTREMTDDEILREWKESKRILEDITGNSVEHAALPYGSVTSCSRKSIKLGLKAGYQTIATTLAVPYKGGPVIPRFVYHNNKPFSPVESTSNY